eukprot:CAMPEP_0179426110 /NCGR_PEP_ID=MMETSP0799-20121207/12551_1 /TAXON_ID=46947 /ORGANISM="Geminigera cryophila, Strain CCMP2564" /LENGTH=287 /DNA_ID=CAMNT_0021200815 /DNA_START=30 /DNA_END=893 /DNA_ORIENTATION=+
MGKRMAAALQKGGHEVMVWNRSPGKAAELVAAGAVEASTPAEVVSKCSVTYAMLADPKASRATVFGSGGVLEGIKPGHAFIDNSTVDEETGEAIGVALQERQARFLCAPVSGGWRDAAKGELLFIAGGDQSVFDQATGEGGGMRAMGHKHWFVGDSPKDAARSKLMLQILMGSFVAATAETLALAKQAGLDQSKILDMFSHSAMANPICSAKGKLMVSGNYDPNFQVYLQQKDLRLALKLAEDLEIGAPITAAVNAQYLRAKQLGHSNADFAAVRTAYDSPAPPSKL